MVASKYAKKYINKYNATKKKEKKKTTMLVNISVQFNWLSSQCSAATYLREVRW